jgi:hypothetical protein
MSTLTQAFVQVQRQAEAAVKHAQALEKTSKVIGQLTDVVTKAGYKSLDAFYNEVEALAAGKTMSTKSSASSAKEPKAKKARAKTGGKRSAYTDADRQRWLELYQGEAKGNLKEVARIFGKPEAYQTIMNTKKKEKWSEPVAAATA